jgi:hypothetical protein
LSFSEKEIKRKTNEKQYTLAGSSQRLQWLITDQKNLHRSLPHKESVETSKYED